MTASFYLISGDSECFRDLIRLNLQGLGAILAVCGQIHHHRPGAKCKCADVLGRDGVRYVEAHKANTGCLGGHSRRLHDRLAQSFNQFDGFSFAAGHVVDGSCVWLGDVVSAKHKQRLDLEGREMSNSLEKTKKMAKTKMNESVMWLPLPWTAYPVGSPAALMRDI